MNHLEYYEVWISFEYSTLNYTWYIYQKITLFKFKSQYNILKLLAMAKAY